jgi:Family of unknown function (DUF5947)
MAAHGPTLASPRLRRLAQRPVETAPGQQEQCELCGHPVPAEHRHVLNLDTRELLCACRSCSLLFDRRAAGGGHFRLVPDRRLVLEPFTLSDVTWEQLRIPVDIAFFFISSAVERVMAFYPSPMGATESRLDLATWQEVERANPVLVTLEPDVEALLVDRAKGSRRQWLVPVEDCYRLVALIRTRWRGFTGGKEVWAGIDDFFADLDRHAHRFKPASTESSPERS